MEITSDYCQHFDPEWYLQAFHNFEDENGKMGVMLKFVMDLLHQFFMSDVKFGDRLLDIGTGPAVWSILTASRCVKHIDLSDYTPRNLTILKDWKEGKRGGDKSFIKYEMNSVDGRRSVSDRKEEIRSKVKGIYHIDVRTENVFLEAQPDKKTYDVITTTFCLESASKIKEEYMRSVRNITRLLKAGGHLIMFGALEENSYRVGDFLFTGANVNAEEVRSVIVENGFKILNWTTLLEKGCENKEDKTLTDGKNTYALFAEKL